jgi:cytochrome c oxidase assembly factor CtaG
VKSALLFGFALALIYWAVMLTRIGKGHSTAITAAIALSAAVIMLIEVVRS